MRWVNTRSLCFANCIECDNYPAEFAHDRRAAGSIQRCAVLFAPSSPPPLTPARGRRGAKRRRLSRSLSGWPTQSSKDAKKTENPFVSCLERIPHLIVTPLRLPARCTTQVSLSKFFLLRVQMYSTRWTGRNNAAIQPTEFECRAHSLVDP